MSTDDIDKTQAKDTGELKVDPQQGTPQTASTTVTFDLLLDGSIIIVIKNVSMDATLSELRNHQDFIKGVGSTTVDFIRRNKPIARNSEANFVVQNVLSGEGQDLEVNLKTSVAQIVSPLGMASNIGAVVQDPLSAGINEGFLKRVVDYIDERRANKKRKLSTSGFTFKSPLSGLNNKQMGQYLRDNAQLEEVDISDIFCCRPRPAVAALKWLQLHSTIGDISLNKWNSFHNQLSKQIDEDDGIVQVKEIVYYPLLLAFFTAAALGQTEVQFASQNYSQPAPREDIIGWVNGVAECPTEVKLVTCASNGAKGGGILANMKAFAGLARCLSKVADDFVKSQNLSGTVNLTQEYLCTYVNRVQAVYIAKIKFDFESRKIASVVVGPKIPLDRNYDDMLLCPVKNFVGKSSLREAIPHGYTPGFMNLVQLVDELRLVKQLPIIRLILAYDAPQDFKHELSDNIEILHQGSKSVVFHEKGSNNCIKVGFADIIKAEWKAHAVLDPKVNEEVCIRRGLGTGSIIGAGGGLRFIELEGFGIPFREALRPLSAKDRKCYWDQGEAALNHIHSKGYLHGDIKPDNMLIIEKRLKVNDFDSCCQKDQVPVHITEKYASPRVSRNCGRYTARDDFCSLLLSFLSLDHPEWENGREKQDLLLRVKNDKTTESYLSNAAASYS